MPKPKKSDLRTGDVIRFAQPLTFGGHQHFLHGQIQGLSADTFEVDVLPPRSGQKTPQYALYHPDQRDTALKVRKWKDFEIVSRLPEDVQVFKTCTRHYGGPVHFTQHLLGPDGQSWNDKALVAAQAMQAARELGCAAVVFCDFGYAQVWPVPVGIPDTAFLVRSVQDPCDGLTIHHEHRLPPEQYIVYAGDNALSAESPVLNEVAQFALLNDPQLRRAPSGRVVDGRYQEHPDKKLGLLAGNVVMLVGFTLNDQGATVRVPLRVSEQAAG